MDDIRKAYESGMESLAEHLASKHDMESVSLANKIARKNYGVTSKTLDHLSKSPHCWVKTDVLWHHMVDPNTIASLAKSGIPVVRSMVARHPKTPAKALDYLLKSSQNVVYPGIRNDVVRHKNVSKETLRHAAEHDPDFHIKRLARERLEEEYPDG